MKNNVIAFLFFLAASGNAMASDLKIGFVSVEKLLAQSPQVEAVNTAMIERFGGKKDELVSMQKEIESMQENYKRNELVMTEDKLNELKSKLIAKVQIFKQTEATLGQEVNTMRSQELSVLKDSVTTIINSIAKKDDFDLILSEGVVYASDKVDITEAVLKQMKEDFKKKEQKK